MMEKGAIRSVHNFGMVVVDCSNLPVVHDDPRGKAGCQNGTWSPSKVAIREDCLQHRGLFRTRATR